LSINKFISYIFLQVSFFKSSPSVIIPEVPRFISSSCFFGSILSVYILFKIISKRVLSANLFRLQINSICKASRSKE